MTNEAGSATIGVSLLLLNLLLVVVISFGARETVNRASLAIEGASKRTSAMVRRASGFIDAQALGSNLTGEVEMGDIYVSAEHPGAGRDSDMAMENPMAAASSVPSVRVTVENPIALRNQPTSPLTHNHSETQTQVEEDGDEKDDRLFEGANEEEERNQTSSVPTWHSPELGQPQQEDAWEEHVDDQGTVFYHNSATGETTWYPPELGQPQQEDAWEEHVDEEGTVFFHNSVTGETTWDRPQVHTVEIDGTVHTWTKDDLDGI